MKTHSVDVASDLTVYGIEIPEIHYQDQKRSNENIQTITEVMKQQCRIHNKCMI
jgi:hypothetical protein